MFLFNFKVQFKDLEDQFLARRHELLVCYELSSLKYVKNKISGDLETFF